MSETKRSRSNYPKEKLQEALQAVIEGRMTSVKAAELYQIPQSTIRSHVNKPTMRVGGGRRFYLDQLKELHLVEMIKALEKIGVRLTRLVLRKVIDEYLRLTTEDPRFKSKTSDVNCVMFFCYSY
jgi:transposase-like protein